MQRKYLIRIVLILVLVAGSFLIMHSATKKHQSKPVCNETLEACCDNNQENPSGEMLWESLSRQFFTSTEFFN